MSFRKLVHLLASCLLLFSVGCTAAATPEATATLAWEPTEAPIRPTATRTLTPTSTPIPTPTPYLHSGWTHFTNALNSIQDMAFDNDGYLWAATRNQGLLKWDIAAKSYQQITKTDGLPGDNTSAIAIAPDGSVWVGFGNYVNLEVNSLGITISRWDGVAWKSFTFDAPPEHLYNGIDSMAFAPDGKLWVTGEDNILSFDGRTWMDYTPAVRDIPEKDSNSLNSKSSIAIAPDGNVWAITHRKGLLRFNGSSWSPIGESEGLIDDSMESLYISADGTVWIIFDYSDSAAVGFFKGSEWGFLSRDAFHNCAPGSLTVDPDGKVWFSGCPEIIRSDGTTWETFDGVKWSTGETKDWHNKEVFIPFAYARSMLIGPDHSVWFGTGGRGIFRLDGDQIEAFTANAPVAGNYRALATAVDGSIWVSAYECCISRFDGKQWTSFYPQPGLPIDWALDIAAAPDGSVWFTGPDEIVTNYANEAWHSFSFSKTSYWVNTTQVYAALDGTIWFSIGEWGALMLKGKTQGKVSFASSLPYSEDDDIVRSIGSGPDGSMWFGTDAGIAKYVNGKKSFFLIPGEMIDPIFVTRKGEVWFGARDIYEGPPGGREGFYYLSRFSETAVDFIERKELKGQYILSIAESPDGMLWVGSDQGLYSYDGTEWQSWGEEPGAGDYHELTFAKDGSIWMLQYDEIVRFQSP